MHIIAGLSNRIKLDFITLYLANLNKREWDGQRNRLPLDLITNHELQCPILKLHHPIR